MSDIVLTPSFFRAYPEPARQWENGRSSPQIAPGTPLLAQPTCAINHPTPAKEGSAILATALEAREWIFIIFQVRCHQVFCESSFQITLIGRSPATRHVAGGRVTLELFASACYGLLPHRKTDVSFRRIEQDGLLPELPAKIAQQDIPDGWWVE